MSSTIEWPSESVHCPNCGNINYISLGAESYGDGSSDVWVISDQFCDECGHDFTEDSYDDLIIVTK